MITSNEQEGEVENKSFQWSLNVCFGFMVQDIVSYSCPEFRTKCPIEVGKNVHRWGIDKKKILLEVWTGPDKNVAWVSGVD